MFFSIKSKILFLVGPPRSGTTWLHRELSSYAKSTKFLPECTVLTQQLKLHFEGRTYLDKNRFDAYFGDNTGQDLVFSSIFNSYLSQLKKMHVKSSRETLILKDPELSKYLTSLITLEPDSQILIIIRDPRDVIASYKQVFIRKNELWKIDFAVNQIFEYYYSILQFVKNYADKCVVVKYENLVENGIEELAEKFNLGHRLRSADSASQNVEQMVDVKDPFYSELYIKPTTTDKIGSFKKHLTEEEIVLVENTFCGVMHEYAYEFEKYGK